MLQVNIDKILPVTEARAKIAQVVDEVSRGDVYVLTRGGKPVALVVPINLVDKLSLIGTKNVKSDEVVVQEKPPILPEKVNKATNVLKESEKADQSIVVKEDKSRMPQGIDLAKVQQALSAD